MNSILLENNPVGIAEVTEEGLYYRFSCKCAGNFTGIGRIVIRNGGNKINLGICVPENNCFVLNKKIPRKLFKDESFSFELICDKIIIQEKVHSGMIFKKLDKIEAARLEIVNGQPIIIID